MVSRWSAGEVWKRNLATADRSLTSTGLRRFNPLAQVAAFTVWLRGRYSNLGLDRWGSMALLGPLAPARLTENSQWATPELAETAWVFQPLHSQKIKREELPPKHRTTGGRGDCPMGSLSCPWGQPARLKREGMRCACSVGLATPPALPYSTTGSTGLLCAPRPHTFSRSKRLQDPEKRRQTSTI